jgi:hypothetical protein
MSTTEKQKTRVNYEIEPTWDKAGWKVNIHTYMPAETPQQALDMVMSMYKLEDPDDVDVSVSVKGNEAVDVLFGLEK